MNEMLSTADLPMGPVVVSAPAQIDTPIFAQDNLDEEDEYDPFDDEFDTPFEEDEEDGQLI
jgi:hypothetical protein